MVIFVTTKTELNHSWDIMYHKTLLIVLAGLSIASCKSRTVEEETSDYKTLTVKLENRTLMQGYSARLDGQQVVEVRPQVSGLITRICIDEGQKVRKGQVLFVIDQVPYQAALAEATANVKSAEANLATAKLNLESTEVLREKNVVQDYDLNAARNELTVAEAALAQAQAQEMSARNNLSYTEVKSPVDGIASMIAYRVGALVSSSISEPLVTLSDDSNVYAYFSLNESQITSLTEQYGSLDEFMKRMEDVELQMAGGRMYGEKGHISAVSGIVTTGTGTVILRADFPNDRGLLRSGGSATVMVPTTLAQAVVIPQSATYELQNKTFVYKVVNGKAQSAPVTLYRLNNGTEYVVEEGLQPGDVIIAEGAGLVKEGVNVNIKQGKE
ncbi:efflux transporter, RND family, MFP subunit [Phocaeicola plebeius DSM 17135]|uniref:Efflux transporter, RND family, MFP subunit n=2 Tax=Phocaeicola plebeius TaxID=310297 RepID=B5CWD5_PHOPM|nr:efflux transporter, RND family, MFP subunit [Phocaeicola plebeius DSM 17135]